MFYEENCVLDPGPTVVNPVQFTHPRSKIYGVDKCVDTTIGFEFVREQLIQRQTRFCNSIAVALCVPVEVVSEIALANAEFVATDDPCFKDFIIDKKIAPDIELQRNTTGNVTGILVRFYRQDTCCYPPQMTFQLYGYDSQGCKTIIARGLLAFR